MKFNQGSPLNCVLLFAISILLSSTANADRVCLKFATKNGKQSVTRKTTTASRCAKGYVEVLNTSAVIGATGPTGANGAPGATGSAGATGATGAVGATGTAGSNGSPGADGSLRIYGDGNLGAAVVNTSSSLPNFGNQFTDFTVDAGVVLTLSSGTIIRCTGTFTNNGTITVNTAARGGRMETRVNPPTTLVVPSMTSAQVGVGVINSANGELGPDTVGLFGGIGGGGLGSAAAITIRVPGIQAGGAGGAAINGAGGEGGGSLVILAKTSITNSQTGLIQANGAGANGLGGGGGGGGIVILASPGSINNSLGTISVVGGAGGGSASAVGAGGGGGGGLVNFISPALSQGTIVATGGAVGSTGTAVTSSIRSGGGGGGGTFGSGGFGMDVQSNDTQVNGSAGSAGGSLFIAEDPTSLF